MRNDPRPADAKNDVKPDAHPGRDRRCGDVNGPELRSRFGLHAMPFTREIRVEDQMHVPFFDEVLDGLFNAVDQRSSAALVAPAGTGKTALLRRLVARLPEARYQVRYVKVTSLSKRDMCREIAATCGIPPAGAYPFLVRGLQERFETCASAEGLRPVLLLDEAHELRPDVLGILRILTNFEMDSRLVLSVVLAGQPALQTMLWSATTTFAG
jgi:type II secretory pathway predicted ATPase ExeA